MQSRSDRANAITIIVKASLAVCAACLAVAVACRFLPAGSRNAITIFSLANATFAVGAITLVLFVFYLIRLLRNIGHFTRVKRVGLTIVTLGFLAVFYLVAVRGGTADDTDCQRFNYNDKLNGGVKQINGTTYVVSICGSGYRGDGPFSDQNEQVKLIVSDAHGSILATRLFYVFSGGRPGHDAIEIRDGKLIYFDASDTSDSTRSISMPPTTFDWITARMPLRLAKAALRALGPPLSRAYGASVDAKGSIERCISCPQGLLFLWLPVPPVRSR